MTKHRRLSAIFSAIAAVLAVAALVAAPAMSGPPTPAKAPTSTAAPASTSTPDASDEMQDDIPPAEHCPNELKIIGGEVHTSREYAGDRHGFGLDGGVLVPCHRRHGCWLLIDLPKTTDPRVRKDNPGPHWIEVSDTNSELASPGEICFDADRTR
jgi:hypothetical protein